MSNENQLQVQPSYVTVGDPVNGYTPPQLSHFIHIPVDDDYSSSGRPLRRTPFGWPSRHYWEQPWFEELQRKQEEMTKNQQTTTSASELITGDNEDGDTVTYGSGAKRSSDADDVRLDLIPPLAEERVGRVLATGGKKYGEHNWRKGTAFSVCLRHLMLHINKYRRGDRSIDHLAHATCNLLFLMEYEAIHPEMNDLLDESDFQPPAVDVGESQGEENVTQ